MRYIGIIILLVLCLTLLLLTDCMINKVKPEPASGNLENQEDINQSSNNSQIADTEKPGTVYPQKWATGDGTAENPWANNCIQSAYDNTPDGGTIFLRAGYYTLGSMLYIDKRINIIGESIGKTFIVTGSISIDAIYMEAQDYVTLQGFTLDADSQTSGNSAISIHEGCSYITLKDIEVKNAFKSGIQYYEGNYSTFQNIWSHDNGDVGLYSISNVIGKNNYNLYRDIYCYDNNDEGFKSRIGEGEVPISQTDNIFDNIQTWDNGQNGIGIYYQKGIVLSNSMATGNANRGIYLEGLEDSNIYDCSATLNKEQGIIIMNSDGVNLTNIIVKNNNSGIHIKNSSDIRLVSCQSYDDKETPLQLYGLELTKTITGISLLNCKLTPNKNGAIYNPTGVVITVITEKR